MWTTVSARKHIDLTEAQRVVGGSMVGAHPLTGACEKRSQAGSCG